MQASTIKAVIPRSVRNWLQKRPAVANLGDRIVYGKRELPVFNGIRGMLAPNEREYLFYLGAQASGTIVEIGCYAGLSTFFLGRGAQISGSHVYSIDPFMQEVQRQEALSDGSYYLDADHVKPTRESVQETMHLHDLESVVTLIEGFSDDILPTWNKPISLLWIDGNHLQAYKDFQLGKPHLLSDARVAFHDSYGKTAITQVRIDVERIIDEEKPRAMEHCDSITMLRF